MMSPALHHRPLSIYHLIELKKQTELHISESGQQPVCGPRVVLANFAMHTLSALCAGQLIKQKEFVSSSRMSPCSFVHSLTVTVSVII